MSMRITLPLLVLCFFCQFCLPARAANLLPITDAQEKQWESQRAAYRQTLAMLGKKPRPEYQAAAEKLKDYALYPDLKYREYSHYIGAVSRQEVDNYIARFGDSILATRLRQQYVQMQAIQQNWRNYLAEYQPGQYGARFECQYYWALHQTGKRDQAFAGARKLWLVGTPQDKACDPLFTAWKSAKGITSSLAWERTRLAMEQQQYQLAKNLEVYLPKQQQALSREWRELVRDPKRLRDSSRYRALGDAARPLLVTGFSRLIRQNSALALQLWPQYERMFRFSTDEKRAVTGEFAYVLGANQAPEAGYWLVQAAQYAGNEHLAPMAVRTALRQRDWPQARRSLALLGEKDRQLQDWRYWIARADQHVGPLDPANQPRIRTRDNRRDVLGFHQRYLNALYNPYSTFTLLPESVLRQVFPIQKPEETFKTISRERSFYGFLASERLKQPLQLNQITSQVTEEELRALTRKAGIRRARELYLLGETFQSRLEWHHMINRMSPKERGAAAHLAYIWGWHNPALLAAVQSTAFDNLEIRFPTLYKDEVLKHAENRGLDPDWVYSVIRQESAFMPAAKSPVGALGIMQIMPATAKLLSRSMRTRAPSLQQLLEPDRNIEMGTFFLKQLSDQFDGNIVLATAAYNAGPGRARAWQPDVTPAPGDIWIETIPFKETRDYVKNIVTYQAIYRHLLGRNVALSRSVAAIPPKYGSETAAR